MMVEAVDARIVTFPAEISLANVTEEMSACWVFFFRVVLDQFMQSACFERHSESSVERASEAVEMSRVFFFLHASSEGLMKGLAGCVKMKSETQSDCVKSACDRVQAGENWSM